MNGSQRDRRILVIVNPHATTVSDRLRNLVIYALQGRFEVEVEATVRPDHATEIGRGARDGAWDMVVAFGGDGTINEVANGLAGTEIPLALLPGGNTNVVCRTLGIPTDVVEATELLLSMADRPRIRRIALGRVDERYFVFACGCGLDASVVEKVDANPSLKSTAGPWFYSWSAVTSYYREYLRDPVQFEVEVDGRRIEGLTCLAQNSDPYTYFGDRPVKACPPVAIEEGSLSMAILKRASQLDAITLVPRLLSGRLDASRHSQVEGLTDVREAIVRTKTAGMSFPVQVDGDHIGTFEQVAIAAVPDALSVVA
jgi:diacylglycerol kinase family enzyme